MTPLQCALSRGSEHSFDRPTAGSGRTVLEHLTCSSPASSAESKPETPQRIGEHVRSELIFRAKQTVANKYKLCQTASKATRRLHLSSKNTTDTINSAFVRIADDLIEPVTVVILPILS
jgi:hypothetical protein